MVRTILKTALATLAIVTAIGLGSGAANAVELPKAAKKCKSCHTFEEGGKKRSGPNLWGVAGQPAGSKEDYKYSNALTEAAEGGLVWDDASLDAFLKKPKDFIKKTKMGFPGVKDEADRAEIIEFLKSLN